MRHSRELSGDLPRRIYEFILHFIEAEGVPPTNREIGRALGISSTGHIAHHLRMLEKQGWISRKAKKSRGIRPTTRSTGIPVRGTIAAGAPLDIFHESAPILTLPYPNASEEEIYALKVRGDSMVEDAICNGDYVVIRPALAYHDGEIIVATHWLEGVAGSATLKRLFRETDQVRLQPANSEMAPLLVPKREWKVQGKVVAIVRSYEVD